MGRSTPPRRRRLAVERSRGLFKGNASQGNPEWDYFVHLRDAGRWTAQSWLAAHYETIGVRGTLDPHDVRP
jgi:hypothetical protein